MKNQTIRNYNPTKENLNSVAQEEIDEIKKRFTIDEPIYEERTKKLFGFIPIGKEKSLLIVMQKFLQTKPQKIMYTPYQDLLTTPKKQKMTY